MSAESELTVLKVAEKLADELASARQSPTPQDLVDPFSRPSLADRFESVFDDELMTVRLVRNSIVHGRPVDDGNLEAAARIARTLEEVWDRAKHHRSGRSTTHQASPV